MILTILVALAGFAAGPQPIDSASPDLPREPMIAIDFMTTPFQLAGTLGSEWLFWPQRGVGAWASASVGRGNNWLAGVDNDFEIFQAGLTWHPSRRLLSNALYVRYCMASSQQEIAVEADKVHVLKYESHQVRVGIVGRTRIWKSLGFYWNAGLGFKAGPSRVEWIGPEPEDAKTLATIVRLVGYLDVGYGLSLEI